jgi:hypothetical protein
MGRRFDIDKQNSSVVKNEFQFAQNWNGVTLTQRFGVHVDKRLIVFMNHPAYL